MFRKPIKIKSNTQVKGSERKVINSMVLKCFPNLTEQDVERIFPKKENLNDVKVVTDSDEIVHVYTVQKRPLIFDVCGLLLPTIYLLWKFPDLVPCFTTHSQVMNFLISGADLMLPGVTTPPNLTGIAKYSAVQEGAVAYVNLLDNKAAVAVGLTAQSSSAMLANAGRGKCLTIYHVWGDKLCTLEGIPNIPVERLGPPRWLQLPIYEQDFPELGARPVKQETPTEEHEAPIEDTETTTEPEVIALEDVNPEDITAEMDNLLNYCFMVAIKYSKTLELPVLTSNFFKLQMMPNCPEGKSLDVKKSSWKKLKPFLDNMCKDGLIQVKEFKKGVESVVSINKDHPKYSEFYVESALRPRLKADDSSQINVTESYIITTAVLPIFEGYNKGGTVQMTTIRKCVTDYVKKFGCQNEENKRLIKPKEKLVSICKTENNITWEELIEKVCQSMTNCYKVTGSGDELSSRGKISPITMTISQRGGNKKVTLIDNLELYGIRIPDFAKECQHGIAASTSISRPPGKKCDQLLVQGNQIIFVHDLLTGKYKIPAKYIRGLENAPKKKKQ